MILLSLLTYFLGSPAHAILGGQRVHIANDELKSVVAIYQWGHRMCTGTLLENNIVITAAHCISKDIRTLEIRFGENAGRPLAALRVKTAVRHASFITEDTQSSKDIGLLLFEGKVPRGFETAKLLTDKNELKSGRWVQEAGYGVTDRNEQNEYLYKARVTIANAAYNDAQITVDQRHGQGGCAGDSGGPAFLRPTPKGPLVLWGVFSSEDNGCESFVAYTSVVAVEDWIDRNSRALAKGTNDYYKARVFERSGRSRILR